MIQKAHLRANASAASRAAVKEAERQALLKAYNEADPKEKETIAAMVGVGVEAAVDAAMKNFKAQPYGEQWKALEDAMWAWQGWRQTSGVERLVLAFSLRDVGIGKWMSSLAAAHRAGGIDA